MQKKFIVIFSVIFTLMLLVGCETDAENESDINDTSFFRDIRPIFFKSLDFNSKAKISELSTFFDDFTTVYENMEEDYKKGIYTTSEDLYNIGQTGFYYGFFMTAIVRGYIDGFLEFEDLNGNKKIGYFSKVSSDDPDFEMKELNAMMVRSKQVTYFASHVNEFDDRTYGAYVFGQQIHHQLNDENHFNNPATLDSIFDYATWTLEDFINVEPWNILMSMATWNNYKDPANTFENPVMDAVLDNLNIRLSPDAAPNGLFYAALVGPLLRIDIIQKKMDWYINHKVDLEEKDLNHMDVLLTMVDTVRNFLETERIKHIETWDFKDSYDARMEKYKEIESYLNAYKSGQKNAQKPEMESLFNSRSFNMSYQCYTCHKLVTY